MTYYYWDEVNDNVFAEEDENGEVVAEYLHEPGLHGKLIAQQRGDDLRYYNYDGLGNTVELTDENGDVTDTYEYSAFGEEIARTGTTVNPFGYKGALGYYTNSDTNDIYVRARAYEPTIARWLSQDPVWPQDGRNEYSYVKNDPVNIKDPSGLMSVTEWSRTGNPDDVRCGQGFGVTWQFKLTNSIGFPPKRPPVCDGYVVQKIDIWCSSFYCAELGGLCPTNQLGPPDKTLYEAFETKELPFTHDTGQVSAPNRSCGYFQARGTLKFFCKAPQLPLIPFGVGDLGGWERPGKWPIGQLWTIPGCLQSIDIRTMPSTDQKPIWWDSKPVDGPATRTIWSSWKCCGCKDQHEVQIHYSPSATATI
ncbi:MAG TPA: RHS repeat-associated core domain-containing protein [Pirellulaceae bacterium]|nr:RHS repeat-associated core domain-containing protein [Pirellulaceae bacterium]